MTLCHFDHPGFVALGELTFRLTKDDRLAALALSVDNADVVVPLSAVAQLFSIRPDSPDGEMLRLVEQSLRFVATIRLGDKLPTEVLTGEASWEPREHHRKTAIAKLQLQLVAWIGGNTVLDEGQITPQMLVITVDDPAIRPRVEEGLRRAANQLGIPGGGAAVAQLIEDFAGQLSYIEALREWLLDRARNLFKRLSRIVQDVPALSTGRRETLVQVVRLATCAVAELGQLFEVVDARTANILETLRDLDRQRSLLRPSRDRLYTTFLAWEPLLKAWDNLPSNLQKEPEGVWRVIDETYRFLAPLYMSVQEWQSFVSAPDKTEHSKSALVW